MFNTRIFCIAYVMICISSVNAGEFIYGDGPSVMRITPAEFQAQLSQGISASASNSLLLQVAESDNFNAKRKQEALTTLLDKKASINAEDPHGRTALYNAIRREGCDDFFIRSLIAKKASLNGGTKAFRFPLNKAITDAMYPVVSILVQAGADLNMKTSEYGTPLQKIAYECDDEKACTMFTILSPGNLDIDKVSIISENGEVACAAICRANSRYPKKNFKLLLFAHGASPWCPASNCKTGPDTFTADELAVHKQWKNGAAPEVMKFVPVKAVVENIVMSYCFWPFKK